MDFDDIVEQLNETEPGTEPIPGLFLVIIGIIALMILCLSFDTFNEEKDAKD